MNIEVHPASADRWPDLETLFGERGACGGCWCLFFRLPRAQYGSQKGEANRQIASCSWNDLSLGASSIALAELSNMLVTTVGSCFIRNE